MRSVSPQVQQLLIHIYLLWLVLCLSGGHISRKMCVYVTRHAFLDGWGVTDERGVEEGLTLLGANNLATSAVKGEKNSSNKVK